MKTYKASRSASLPGQIYAAQVKLLYKNAPLAYLVSVINGGVLAYIQAGYIARRVLFIWYGSLLFLIIVRIFISWSYAHFSRRDDTAPFWNHLYLIGTGLSGCVWGSAAFFLFPIDSVVHQLFIAFVLAGMSAGGIGVLAPRLEVYLAFLLPALLPLFFRYLTLNTPLERAMAAMTFVFLIASALSAKNFYQTLCNSLSLRFDNQELHAEIAKRNQIEDRLYQEKERLQTTLGAIGEGVIMMDADGRITYMNPAAECLIECGQHAAINQFVGKVIQAFDKESRQIPLAMEDSLRTERQVRKHCTLFRKDGKKCIVEELATPLYDRKGSVVGAVSVLRDVTVAEMKAEQLAFAVDHDPLTGLPNRNLLQDRTRQAIARAQRQHENFALLFLDLDRFKEVNDSMGHASGDALLIDVAKRLATCVREEDTIARIGGDEFVVLLHGPAQANQVKTVVDKILRALRKPFQLSSRTISMTASIGSSLYPADGQNIESLLEHADTAMYGAKKHGRDRWHINFT